MVKTSLLLSERRNDAGGAERPSESIRHPDAVQLPLTLNWKWAQRVERMPQTRDLGKGGDNGSDWWSDLLIQNVLSIIHHELKHRTACLCAGGRRWLHQRRFADVYPELFRNTVVLLMPCIKALNLQDKRTLMNIWCKWSFSAKKGCFDFFIPPWLEM